MLIWSETPSAPNRTASSTLPVIIFRLGDVESEVLLEKWTKIPILDGFGRVLRIPLFIMTLVKP